MAEVDTQISSAQQQNDQTTDTAPNYATPQPEFYHAELDTVPPAFSTLLETYSGIPPADQKAHIVSVRNKIWSATPYPCLGRFRFLDLDIFTHPLYASHVLPLLKRPASSFSPPHEPVLLDIGSCLGQDVRSVLADGVDTSRVYGSDLWWGFIDAGYDLFRDEDKLPRDRFLVPADLRDESEGNVLSRLDGKCDVVTVMAVFHLFDIPEQKRVMSRAVRLLRRDKGQRALMLGTQVGRAVPGMDKRFNAAGEYRHNAESWQKLWNEVLEGDEWKDKVQTWEVGGYLEGQSRLEGARGQNGDENIDYGFKCQVWWIWIEFS